MLVRWTDAAVQDFTQICDDIDIVAGRLRAGSHSLSTRESICSQNFQSTGERGLPYLAVYRIHEITIEIVRILHGAQKWPD